MSYVEVSGSLIEVLQRASTHKYLGRLIVGNLKGKLETKSADRCRSLGRNSTKKQPCLDEQSCVIEGAFEIFRRYDFSSCVVWFKG